MSDFPNCPKCDSEYTYKDGHIFICPECFHEWSNIEEKVTEVPIEDTSIKDAYGNNLIDGDDVSIIKDLKVNGSSSVLKRGTIVKGIRLVDSDHNIDCKIDGFGAMSLKSEFVKKL